MTTSRHEVYCAPPGFWLALTSQAAVERAHHEAHLRSGVPARERKRSHERRSFAPSEPAG
jgi:hypothetical protein